MTTNCPTAKFAEPLAPLHPKGMTRRRLVQVGAVGLLGLGVEHLPSLQAGADDWIRGPISPKRRVIFLFLSGGLAQHESFDPKPNATDLIRGEFGSIPTRFGGGVRICEHLPKLAECSHLWSMVRSLTHGTNDHSLGHHVMLTGRSSMPAGFSPNQPSPTDEPSIASVAGAVAQARNNLPPAVVLPEKLVHSTGRIIPGQFAGRMGQRHDPWFLELSPYDPNSYGSYPTFGFDHQDRPQASAKRAFEPLSLSLPTNVTSSRLNQRLQLLSDIDRQRASLDQWAGSEGGLDAQLSGAVALLTNPKLRQAFDLRDSDPKLLDRYGRHSFGSSCLVARRMVGAGVPLVQVNLGNNETWDTHGNAFPHLKNSLLPPMDQAVSALIQDLHASGELESTLIVMAGEFGRTPKISHLREHYKLPGRDHWGRVQSILVAGGGIAGGQVIGSSDAVGGSPASRPVTPEQFAATIYHSLGLPPTIAWFDHQERPHAVYHGDPIQELFS
ncbi:MAG: DUF1501 domain-containing protein [Planctomycetota bacterium]|nr:DUF1501 domain-containing protein [Planctomycetota bacterium]